MDGKHSMRLQNVKVYVWTGPNSKSLVLNISQVVLIPQPAKCVDVFVIHSVFFLLISKQTQYSLVLSSLNQSPEKQLERAK